MTRVVPGYEHDRLGVIGFRVAQVLRARLVQGLEHRYARRGGGDLLGGRGVMTDGQVQAAWPHAHRVRAIDEDHAVQIAQRRDR